MPLVGEGEEENATGRGGGGGECHWWGRRRMEYMNGVHLQTWLTQYVMNLEHS